MKKSLLIVSVLGLLAMSARADIAPDATGTPLFTIHSVKTLSSQPTTDASGQPQPQFDISKKSLLIVTSVADIALDKDFKAVEVDLNAKDKQTLAKITGTHKLLAFVCADGKTTLLSQITGQITNGILIFSDAHHSGPMAAYLRDRFHIKPGTNQAIVPVTHVNPPTSA